LPFKYTTCSATPRRRGPRGGLKGRIDAAFDEEVHVGSDVYKQWLADPSDLVVPGRVARTPGCQTSYMDQLAAIRHQLNVF
jgi:hypothetical protein